MEATVLGPVQLMDAALTPAGFQFTGRNLVPGRLYTAQHSFTLGESSWFPLGATFVGPPATTQAFLDPAIDPKTFYRIVEIEAS